MVILIITTLTVLMPIVITIVTVMFVLHTRRSTVREGLWCAKVLANTRHVQELGVSGFRF